MSKMLVWALGRTLVLGGLAWSYSVSTSVVEADDACYSGCTSKKDYKGNCTYVSCDSGSQGVDTCQVATCDCTFSGNSCGKEA